MMALIERNGGVGVRPIRALSKLRFSQSPKGARSWLGVRGGDLHRIHGHLSCVCKPWPVPCSTASAFSRERLAYLIDSIAPVCILIPQCLWAINLGLLENTGLNDPLGVFVSATFLNIYAFSAVAFAAATIAFGWRFGPMGAADDRAAEGCGGCPPGRRTGRRPGVKAMLGTCSFPCWPCYSPCLSAFGLLGTGIYGGLRSKAVLWGVLAGLIVTALQAARQGTAFAEIMETSLAGAANLLTISVILLFALALGTAAKALGTASSGSARGSGVRLPAPGPGVLGKWNHRLLHRLLLRHLCPHDPWPSPLALDLGLPPSLLLATVLGGAVAFGDHASPISDTTVVALLAAEASHIEHVRTQLPFALCAGAITLAAYLGLGVLYTA